MILVDVDVTGVSQMTADIGRGTVAASVASADLVATDNRGFALWAMARGAARFAGEMHQADRLDRSLSLGRSGGLSVAAAAMRALPIGFSTNMTRMSR